MAEFGFVVPPAVLLPFSPPFLLSSFSFFHCVVTAITIKSRPPGVLDRQESMPRCCCFFSFFFYPPGLASRLDEFHPVGLVRILVVLVSVWNCIKALSLPRYGCHGSVIIKQVFSNLFPPSIVCSNVGIVIRPYIPRQIVIVVSLLLFVLPVTWPCRKSAFPWLWWVVEEEEEENRHTDEPVCVCLCVCVFLNRSFSLKMDSRLIYYEDYNRSRSEVRLILFVCLPSLSLPMHWFVLDESVHILSLVW